MFDENDISVAACKHSNTRYVSIGGCVYIEAFAAARANIQARVEVVRPQIAHAARQRISLTGPDRKQKVSGLDGAGLYITGFRTARLIRSLRDGQAEIDQEGDYTRNAEMFQKIKYVILSRSNRVGQSKPFT